MRYWFLKLEVRAGEYEVTTSSVHKTNRKEEFDSEDYAQNFWNEGEEQDGTYFFDCGCIAVSVWDCKEITKKEYDVMEKYL